MLCEGTPADGEDVARVELAPVIEGAAPAVEHDEDLVALHLADGGRADEVRVLLVHSLQLHAWLEVVLSGLGRFLQWWHKPECLDVTQKPMVFGGTGITFLKAVPGAISAPFKVLNRNMGHEEAFMRNPEKDHFRHVKQKQVQGKIFASNPKFFVQRNCKK